MFSDNTLLPKEAVRLATLGALSFGPRSHAELADEVQHFVSRITGPSLELLGISVDLLRHEGLIAQAIEGDDTVLELTDSGWAEFRELLSSSIRPPLNDLNKLILALKMRFLHVLPPAARRDQVDMMIEAERTEIARLADLRRHHADEPGHLVAWLDHDIHVGEYRLKWLEEVRAAL